MSDNIELSDGVAFEKINSNGEGIIVHFLMDAEGTLFLKYDPTEMLDREEQDLYFLAHPSGKPDAVREKLMELVKRNNLEELFMEIKVPNIYAVCDILASKWLELKGGKQEEITRKRAEIETKMRKWNDPYIIEHLVKKYPGLKITVLTQASPEQYIKDSYEETLKNTGAGLIIAPGYEGTSYTKMDPELYRTIIENNPTERGTAFIDDDSKREEPAKKGGVGKVVIYQPGTSLKETSDKAVEGFYKE